MQNGKSSLNSRMVNRLHEANRYIGVANLRPVKCNFGRKGVLCINSGNAFSKSDWLKLSCEYLLISKRLRDHESFSVGYLLSLIISELQLKSY